MSEFILLINSQDTVIYCFFIKEEKFIEDFVFSQLFSLETIKKNTLMIFQITFFRSCDRTHQNCTKKTINHHSEFAECSARQLLRKKS